MAMKTKSEIITIASSVLSLACIFLVGVRDGGNIDFYWKPLLAVWFALTVFSFVLRKEKRSIVFIRKGWWLQIILPIVLFFISIGLVSIHEPYPLRPDPEITEPNQAPLGVGQ